MDKPIKLEEQELKQLQNFKQESEILISQLGQIGFQKFQLEKQEEFLKQKFNQLNEEEISISKNLKEKYGNVDINIETGELTYF